ncbi:phosphonate metabolism transcriptional regulator PhnF [Pseudoruegeria sp. HB172150]|uniref:phosphonate metabolism transcriptional regulator PhnF n=1 Tax=Pseudoruegeria sp. HB172150 TaxID=2721164 RepID=UPI001554BA07|nr:phosphonate metabolism transcriptional regulator PhnF [Pseudoruegeria sp. HB172150]
MSGTSNWERARDWIVESIANAALAEGDKLPPEPQMQREIGVGRHSLRRAVAALAAEGVLSVEQGRGTFVRGLPKITYRIGSRTRYRENMLSQGVRPGGESITEDIVEARPDVAEALAVNTGTAVHCIQRRGHADGRPISLSQSFHPAARFPDLGERRGKEESVTAIYADHGISDYSRRETSIYARLPEKWEARLLEMPADQPVLIMCKLDVDLEGIPIGYSEAAWVAGRIRFLFDSSQGTIDV